MGVGLDRASSVAAKREFTARGVVVGHTLTILPILPIRFEVASAQGTRPSPCVLLAPSEGKHVLAARLLHYRRAHRSRCRLQKRSSYSGCAIREPSCIGSC